YSVPGQTQLLVSEGTVSNQIEVKRFIPCTFNLTLSDEQEPSDILFHLLGNDGIYNQELNLSTDDTGVIGLAAVYMTDYVLTISKTGYQTIVDTISVDLTNNQFNYILQTNDPSLMVQPPNYALYQNFPNPFNPTTEIRFALKNNSRVDLAIFNIKGQKIKQLIDQPLDYGYHKAVWNGVDNTGKRVSSGMYFYVLNVKNEKECYREIKKMIMVK
ncbi:MAG TPA: T9SS type A sorting domain-containing protein, partial [Candidatus Cloacimonadota bacterium]|nr:T9SS type A sorting domain-containing protein [Candidatus Cloacimonadota bacterium]